MTTQDHWLEYARIRLAAHREEIKMLLFYSFWLFVLTAGDPDILDQVIAILGRFI